MDKDSSSSPTNGAWIKKDSCFSSYLPEKNVAPNEERGLKQTNKQTR